MFEFIGAYRILGNVNYEYVKIIAYSVDDASEKLEDYLRENKIRWIDNDISQIVITLE